MAPTVRHVQRIRSNSVVKKVLAIENNGQIVVMLDDVQDIYEDAKQLEHHGIIVPFLVDENDNRIEPLRVEYLADAIYDVICGPTEQDPRPTPARQGPRPDLNFVFDPDYYKVGCAIDRLEESQETKPILFRIFSRKKDDKVVLKNATNTSISIVCAQDLVSVLDNGAIGLNAGAAGVDLKLDVAKVLVGVKEIKSVLKLGPNESQVVTMAAKHAVVSAFSTQGETTNLLFKNALLKRGHQLTVEQRDVDNALTENELAVINL